MDAEGYGDTFKIRDCGYGGCGGLSSGHKFPFLIHISEPTRQAEKSYAGFFLKKKKKKKRNELVCTGKKKALTSVSSV